MLIGILKETGDEKRVVVLPEIVQQLTKMGITLQVEAGAGATAYASDDDYKTAGATIAQRDAILANADLLLKIQPLNSDEVKKLKQGAVYVCFMQALFNNAKVLETVNQKLTLFSLDMIPRTTRAQSMDILSSQATVAGYKAVLEAANQLPRFFPLFMTAAGSITPAKVLIIGAGVAGLQAIATAKRLGAVVEAFDTRSAVKEEVQSLGAKFVEVEGAVDSKAAGGYAVEQSKEYLEKQKQRIHESAAKSDVIITTAQIPGRKAPILITKETVAAMRAGSVIVDLAASTGGNCELTRNNEISITPNGIKIVGNSNFPSQMPSDASKMFGKNVFNFIKLILTKEGQINLNFDDDIVKGTCVAHNGDIVNDRVKQSMAQPTT
jgi:H+-translocating NAD(P) transhydrogenase subunit alpha